ncbi:MAG: hypothetical protein U0797_15750 [Gemmataceae bacterium]
MLVLLAYYPFRLAMGRVFAVLMAVYGIHRSLNEILGTTRGRRAWRATAAWP